MRPSWRPARESEWSRWSERTTSHPCPREWSRSRRGIAGLLYLYKTASAKAEQGANLAEVKRVAEKAKANVRTMGVALTPCILPAVGRATFSIGEGEMEIGMGIHGEPGIRRGNIESADKIAKTLVEAILNDMPIDRGGSVSVLVNGLGATPLEELYILYRSVHRALATRESRSIAGNIGEYATSLEMAGLSVSVLRLDDELRGLVEAPFDTPFHLQR